MKTKWAAVITAAAMATICIGGEYENVDTNYFYHGEVSMTGALTVGLLVKESVTIAGMEFWHDQRGVLQLKRDESRPMSEAVSNFVEAVETVIKERSPHAK